MKVNQYLNHCGHANPLQHLSYFMTVFEHKLHGMCTTQQRYEKVYNVEEMKEMI